MEPNGTVKQVMEREFSGRMIEVVGPYLPGEGNDVAGHVLQIHVNIPEIQRCGTCCIDKREKAANSPKSLDDLWKCRAEALAINLRRVAKNVA